jgi:hypothetical protein
LQSLDPAIPLFDFNTMQQAMAEERSGVKAAAGTMNSYAVIALLLAITGIYAVVLIWYPLGRATLASTWR